jgi:NhaA family Na+:H+ antiporter
VLLAAAAVALLWANSPWRHGYAGLWEHQLTLRSHDISRSFTPRAVVDEGLMTLFFLVVGLEIKRELVSGELHHWQRAALPACAALGGMAVPALLYVVVNGGGTGGGGWGVPMATDIAFAVGVVALVGPRVPAALKVFLLTLAVVDDVGAILVIAIFYAGRVGAVPLAVATGAVVAIVVLRLLRVTWLPAYALVGLVLWGAVYESGVHATIAGVILGLLTPVRGRDDEVIAERLEDRLHPLTSLGIIPVFALANAGVTIDHRAFEASGASQVAAGVALGLVVGKPLGILGAAWLALRVRVGTLPDGLGLRDVARAGVVAGIGFTVALFIAGLGFDSPDLEAAAKIGIVAGSIVAAVLGYGLLRATRKGGLGS